MNASDKTTIEQMCRAMNGFGRDMIATAKVVNQHIEREMLPALIAWGRAAQKHLDEAAAKINERRRRPNPGG